MSMPGYYLVGVLIPWLSLYGFRSRRRTMEGLLGSWSWRGTALRGFLWLTWFGLLARISAPSYLWGLLAGLVAWLLGEGGVLWLRWALRRGVEGGHPYGRPQAHFQPLVAALLYPFLARSGWWLTGWEVASIPPPWTQLLLLGTVITGLWSWANLVTVSVVEMVRPQQLQEEVRPRIGAGEVIGVLERYLTALLVAAGGWTAVGFVVAAKAAARFPLFKERAFAEYFLIGTLTSVGLAIAAGLLGALPWR